MTLISILIPCLNEEENIRRCHARVAAVLDGLEDVGQRPGVARGVEDDVGLHLGEQAVEVAQIGSEPLRWDGGILPAGPSRFLQ